MILSFLLSCIHSLFAIIFYYISYLFYSRLNLVVKYIQRNETLFQKPIIRAYHSTPHRCMLKTHNKNNNDDHHKNKNKNCDDELVNFQPLTGGSVPRFAGLATLMRLPHLDISTLKASNVVDVGLIGIPWVCCIN